MPTPKASLRLATHGLRDSNLGSKEWGRGFSTHLLPGVKRKLGIVLPTTIILKLRNLLRANIAIHTELVYELVTFLMAGYRPIVGSRVAGLDKLKFCMGELMQNSCNLQMWVGGLQLEYLLPRMPRNA